MASILKVNTIQDATNSNTAMTIDTSGRIFTGSNRPHVFCRGFGSVTTDTATINGQTMDTSWGIHFNADEVTENQGNHYDNSTGFFRVPVTGLYQLHAGYGYKAANNEVGMSWVTGTSSDHGIMGITQGWTGTNGSAGDSNTISMIMTLTAGNDVCIMFRETTYTYPLTGIDYFRFSITHMG